ncbi:MAG: hypothetical protein IJH00_03165 [Erysipelotrichaceae bacterium]|nr:hypothetical protein [Erysipelotrichaceae bacterium]
MIYLTSDLHFGHKWAIGSHDRPFASVEEMNETLLRNYNSIVRDEDIVYILGDLCRHLRLELANEIISKMKGKKYLLLGNNDKGYDPKLFVEIRDFKRFTYHGVRFVLMHYPLLDWPEKEKGSIHLHGHIHAGVDYNLKNLKNGIRRFDVGVDANNYFPVSLDAIIDFFGVKVRDDEYL